MRNRDASLVVVGVVASIGMAVAVFGYITKPTMSEGQVYQVMLYDCTTPDGAPMVDVHFVGENRDMKPQLVPADLVFNASSSGIPIGSGVLQFVRYGATDRMDYGWRREFRFNGQLQPLSVERECSSR